MKKRNFLSILLAIVFVLSLSVGVAAEDKVYVMDFTSYDALAAVGGSFNTDQGEDECGVYSFTEVNGVGCLQLEYLVSSKANDSWMSYAAYRCQPRLGNAWDKIGSNVEADRIPERPTADHKYVRVTYMTTETTPCTITLARGNGGNATRTVVVADTSVSAGKFVTAEAVDISATELNVRASQGNHLALEFQSTSPDSEIYIKEIAFFKTLEQANAYVVNLGATDTTPSTPDTTPSTPDTTPSTPNTPDTTPNTPDTTPNTPDTTPNTPDNTPTTSPDTFDVVVIATAITAASGAAFIALSKKRK